jgi:putative transposase
MVAPYAGTRRPPQPDEEGTKICIPATNPIESVFATVRHRTVRTKGAPSQDTARLMVFKLVMAAAKIWRRLKGEKQLPKVTQGVTFRNGVEVTDTPAQTAA